MNLHINRQEKYQSLDRSLEASDAYYAAMFAPLGSKKEQIRAKKKQKIIGFYQDLATIESHLQEIEGGFGHKYNPNQPRNPAGQSDGGQWTGDAGGSGGFVDQQPKPKPTPPINPSPQKPTSDAFLEALLGALNLPKLPKVIMNYGDDNSPQHPPKPPIYRGAPDLPLESVYPLETLLALGGVFSALRGLTRALTGLLGDATGVGGASEIGAGAAGAAGVETETAWTLGSYKSPQRWANQMQKRGWTTDEITNTIANGKQYEAPNFINRGNTATRYEYNGNYVVRDNQTREIIQIGEPDFIRPPIPVSGKSLYKYKFPQYQYMERKMGENTIKIYINLLEEGTPTWRPTQAIPTGNGLYKILPTPKYDPEDEIWEFLPNSIVRCEPRKSDKGEMVLLAVELVS